MIVALQLLVNSVIHKKELVAVINIHPRKIILLYYNYLPDCLNQDIIELL